MRNEITLSAIASELQRNCGDTLAACKAVGVSLIFVNQWRKDDKAVDEQLLEAERVGVQGLYSAAIRRGVEGVTEDVWYKGEVVGAKQVYSDGLLNTLLAAKLQDFKKGADGLGVQVNVQVANLMPRAETYDQWLTMKAQTLTLPPPSDAAIAAPIEAEYSEITPASVFQGIDL